MFSISLLCALFAAVAIASPIQKRQTMSAPSDIQILQYALNLENLESAFYQEALSKFDAAAFASAGFGALVRERFEEILTHEQSHVAFLTEALGSQATQACTYSFPYTDPKSFAALSMVLEGVGLSAYLGAAQFITSKTVLTAAGSILATEARHASWVASAVDQVSPWSGSFDVPLDFDQVSSLASTFITSCPSTNPMLPFKEFPTLSVTPAAPVAGTSVTLAFTGVTPPSDGLYLALFSGLSTTFVEITNNFQITLPTNLTGTVYGVISTSGTTVSDDTTVAGPVIFQFPDPLTSA